MRRFRIAWQAGLTGLLLTLAIISALALGASAAQAHGATASTTSRAEHATRPMHALLVKSDPPADAILSAPPTQVKAWFSEPINSLSSGLVVVDPTNHEVDTRDSHVSSSNPTELIVGLQLLRPGTYVVVWRTQSQVDGHVTGGSFIFRVANADGSVPPVPKVLPSGHVPGAAGYGAASQGVDGPTILQTISTWLALLFLTIWVGGVIWETWVLPVRRAPDPVVEAGALLGARRFRRLAPYLLGGLLLADVTLAMALTAETAGGWRGVLMPQFWRATLFGGGFGTYWWMRQAVSLAALVLTLTMARRSARRSGDASGGDEAEAVEVALQRLHAEEPGAIPSWTQAALHTMRQTPRLPGRLLRGWLDLPIWRQAEVALAMLLLFAFAMSGHAAAAPPSERVYAVSVDMAHLIFEAAWLGGLLYISVALIPAATALSERARALLLARGVPAFGAVAIVSATLLALTGSLNTGVRLSSAEQFITTDYGRTLVVKIELFLIMVAISAYHAFRVRPRLARALTESAASAQETQKAPETTLAQVSHAREASGATAALNGAGGDPSSAHLAPPQDGTPLLSQGVRRLAGQMEDWLRREALLGVGVLLCVALLAAFSGTLTPTQATAPTGSSGPFKETHTVSGYAITLAVSPASFGSNTFTVTLKDKDGKPAQGASVLIITDMLDMDMGQQNYQLKSATGGQPGVYSGSGDLTMAGNWKITVKMLPQGAKSFINSDFKLVAGS